MTAPPAEKFGKKPRSFAWRRAPTRLPRDHVERQGLITHLAFAVLGGRDPAMSFLNTYHGGLDARPLDLAGGSAAGYSSVRGELLRVASLRTGDQA